MSSTFGDNLKLSIFGQSHGPAIGMVLDGIPAGLPVDFERLQGFLNRRAPGQNQWSTPRKEEDRPEFLGGILDGYTCGAPIAAVIPNQNTRSQDYSALEDRPRPGHADYTASIKYGGFQDAAGGGHFSGRLTAAMCIAGGLCKQWLENQGIFICGHILSLGGILDDPAVPTSDTVPKLCTDFPVFNQETAVLMKEKIEQTRKQSDSIGGFIECIITGVPAGIGEPMFSGVEGKLSQALFAIPAVKSVSFGDISSQSSLLGSSMNDEFCWEKGSVRTKTNHCGGILGGITNGMPLVFRVGIKPTPSIAQAQQTVSLSNGTDEVLSIQGRHDPCILPRAVCVAEAAAALSLYDLILGNTRTHRRKQHGTD